MMWEAKGWGEDVSGGQVGGVCGLVGVNTNHRSTSGFRDLEGAAQDVEAAIDHVRTNGPDLGIDPERIAIWTCSAGAPFAVRTALRDRPASIRALVALYSIMDLRPGREMISAVIPHRGLPAFSCSPFLDAGGAFPSRRL